VFDRLLRVRDRRFRTECCSGGSQSRGVRDLAKEQLREGCSVVVREVEGFVTSRRSDFDVRMVKWLTV
jgi:hypothetical protein